MSAGEPPPRPSPSPSPSLRAPTTRPSVRSAARNPWLWATAGVAVIAIACGLWGLHERSNADDARSIASTNCSSRSAPTTSTRPPSTPTNPGYYARTPSAIPAASSSRSLHLPYGHADRRRCAVTQPGRRCRWHRGPAWRHMSRPAASPWRAIIRARADLLILRTARAVDRWSGAARSSRSGADGRTRRR